MPQAMPSSVGLFAAHREAREAEQPLRGQHAAVAQQAHQLQLQQVAAPLCQSIQLATAPLGDHLAEGMTYISGCVYVRICARRRLHGLFGSARR